jgi:glycosyltransferase involved in cell wall biosynthesis
MHVCIVIPTYRSAKFIEQTLDAVQDYAGEADHDVSVVDDGSDDETFQRVEAFANGAVIDVQAIQLYKNRGQFHALMAGLSHAQGDFVVTMDDDLEYPPSQIPRLLAPFLERPGRLDAVIGVPADRKTGPLRQAGTWVKHRVNSLVLNKPAEVRSGCFRMLTGELVRHLSEFRTANPVLGPLIFKATRRVTNVTVTHHEGLRRSNYSLWRLVNTFYDNLLNFSEVPLHYISIAGLLTAMASLSFGLFLVMQYFTGWPWSITAPGWTSTLVVIALASGAILFSVGFLGQYVFRIIEEVNKTPNFQIRSIVRSPTGRDGAAEDPDDPL